MSWKDYLNDNSNNNTTSSGKIKWKDFLEENDNFKKYKADRAAQAEESAKSLYSNQMDYTSPYYVQPKQTDITTPSVVSQPKNEDNGFWAKVRNLNLEDTKLFKAITSPIDALYKIPLTQRILTTAGNTIGGEGAVQNPDGTPMQKLNAGKVGNIVSDLVGTGLGYSMPIAGLNNSLQGATSKIMQPIENVIPKGTSKLAQYGNNALRQGLEFSALNAAQATSENKDYKDIGLSALEGLGQGAAFGTLTKGAGELIAKTKKSAFPDWKTTFESGNSEPLNSIENPLKQPQKTQGDIIAPNEILKPIQSDKGVVDNKGFNLQMFDRSTEQPKKTSEFFSNSLKETQILPEEAKKLLNEADFTYGVKTNKAELLKADSRIKARGMDFEMNRLKQSKSYDNAEDTMAHLLITRNLNDEAQKTGDYSKVVDWLKETRTKTTNTAQALQAVSAWKKTTPEGALIKAQSVVDDVQKDIKARNPKLIEKAEKEVKKQKELNPLEQIEKIREKVYKENNIPTLTPDDAKFITETMTKAQDMPEGYNKNAEIAKVMQLIADKVPATASEKLQAYLRMSMLTNIKTLLVRNPLGNVGLNIAENIKDIPASLIDKAVSLKTGERTTIAPSLKGLAEQGKGLAQGVKEWNMDRKLNIDTSPSRGQYELPSKRIFHNNALNAIDQFTRRSLGLGDRPFYQAAYNERLRQLKVINKSNEITDAMKEDAVNYALDRTLQNKSTLSKGAGMIKKGLNLNKDFGLGSITMPFTTTPANVLDKALDYSPIGALKATAEWGKFLKTGDLNQKKLVDELGRSITGTAAIVLGWELAKNGLATGKSSTNARERELNKATGVNDYSFKIGDKYKTFDWAQPMSLPLAMGIDMYNAKKTKGDIKNALTSAGDTVFKQSFLQGISRMFGGYSPSEGVLNTVGNSYTMAVPTTLRQVQQLSDPLQRETYSDNKNQQTLNTIKSKVPFLSKTLEPKIDVLGNQAKQFDGKNNLFNVLINPGYSNTDKNTPGTNMVRQIVDATNNKDILPKIPDNKITYVSEVKNKGTKNREDVKETINLTPKELTSLKQYIGQETLKLYDDKAKDSTFMGKSPKDKAKELESLLRKIYDKGEENILKSRNITFY